MPVACDPNSLANASACFCGLNERELAQIQVYLLAQIAGGSTDPATLLKQSACWCGLTDDQLLRVQDYLLCVIAGV